MPAFNVFMMLQYLEIIDAHQDTRRELSVVLRNVLMTPGKLPLYVVVSAAAYKVMGTVLVGEMQETVMAAACAEIRRLCGDTV